MKHYKTTPAEVEAVQWDRNNTRDIEVWAGLGNVRESVSHFYLIVNTPDGFVHAHEGDWIVRDANNEFHLVSDDDFNDNYQEVIQEATYDH